MDTDDLLIFIECVKIRERAANIDTDKPNHCGIPLCTRAGKAAALAMSIHGTATIGFGNRYLTARGNTSLNIGPGVFSRIRMFGTRALIQGFSFDGICPSRRMLQ